MIIMGNSNTTYLQINFNFDESLSEYFQVLNIFNLVSLLPNIFQIILDICYVDFLLLSNVITFKAVYKHFQLNSVLYALFGFTLLLKKDE